MGTHYEGTPDEIRAINAYIKLQRAADSVAARVTNHLTKVKLTFSQYGVLDMLYHLGPLSQGQIAEKLVKSGGNITMVVDNLERRGLVVRKRSEIDRRVVTVSLTEQGRQVIIAILPVHIAAIVEEMSVLTPIEQALFDRLSRRLGKREPCLPVEEASSLEEKTGA